MAYKHYLFHSTRECTHTMLFQEFGAEREGKQSFYTILNYITLFGSIEDYAYRAAIPVLCLKDDLAASTAR